ncbi:family 16 glycoside hydrolase [Chitinophaga sp. S165]|uniref:family 16 glycoside hydrolase n=1 Tax=Chitinophaga sp. S165 TaxID=2135462 RepID=UPI000D886C21|nr:family 16 glycoside hydrolase [Chitinophaga sp. S165]PWV48297.1 carbohydrate binding protein [Chitinophaga sp. S165]
MLVRRSSMFQALVCLVFTFFPFRLTFSQDNRILIDVNQTMNRIPSTIYGSCIEDVNHEIYGGFYAQLIFGESFEEPSTGANYRDWRKYTGYWAADNEYSSGSISIVPERGTKRVIGKIDIGVEPDDHARLIYQPLTLKNGIIAFDIRMPDPKGESAGILLRTSCEGTGENSLRGYGISVSRDGKKMLLTKHNNNYQLLKEASISIDAIRWNHVRVAVQERTIKVWLNNSINPLIDYEDNNEPILQGKIGLTTNRAPAAFRNLIFINGTDSTRLPLEMAPDQQISYNWDAIATQGAVTRFSLTQNNVFHGISAQTIELLSGKGRAGITNRSLNRWGIAVIQGQQFNGSAYLRTESGTVRVTAALENADGTRTYASQTMDLKDNTWKKYSFSLTANAADTNARFALYIEEKGKICVDQVSLFPSGDKLFKQLPLRADIAKAIIGENITFLRYAGSMVNADGYRFKKMIGPRDTRPPYNGHWNKYSTNGFGIEEFLQFSEAAGFEAAFAINIEETAEDAADMIEYLKGAPATTWGKKRAENGHPTPYKVKYIEIGNEEGIFRGDNKEDYEHYIQRFNALYDAMHAKDPGLVFINAAWWRPESKNIEKVFRALDGKAAYWDYHPWTDGKNAGTDVDKELTRMKELFHSWNPSTTMKCAIFEENGALHNMQRALGHATTLNTVRRHGDFLLTSCPANALQPYLQNDNGWDQGQIFFTPTQVWEMPPFYAQQMAALNHLPLRVKETVTGNLDVTATCNERKDTLVLHIVNADKAAITSALEFNHFGKWERQVQTWTLEGPLSTENLPEATNNAITRKGTFNAPADASVNYTFPAHSYTILRFTSKKK